MFSRERCSYDTYVLNHRCLTTTRPLDIIAAPQQPFDVAIRDARLELGLHVAAHESLNPHESALVVLNTHDTLSTIQAGGTVLSKDVGIHEIGDIDVDRLVRLFLEAKMAIPGHVLDTKERPVSYDDHVVIAVTDQDAVGALDDLGQDMFDGVGRGVALLLWARVSAHEDGLIRALEPGDIGSVQGPLNIWSVKVYRRPDGFVVDRGWGSQYIPQQGAHQVDLVEVEARVDVEDLVVDQVEHIALSLSGVVEELGRLVFFWREGKVLFNVLLVATSFVKILELCHERLIEVEQVRVLLDKRHYRYFLLDVIELANAWVVSQGTCSKSVLLVFVVYFILHHLPSRSKYSLSFWSRNAAEMYGT